MEKRGSTERRGARAPFIGKRKKEVAPMKEGESP